MQKPYFYPRTLQAPQYSWLLLSQNYANYSGKLRVFGLIIVTQLRGSIKISLLAVHECSNICNDIKMELHAGESLVFLSDLWTLNYQYSGKDFSITVVTETNFK